MSKNQGLLPQRPVTARYGTPEELPPVRSLRLVRLTAQTASGLPLHFAGLVLASGSSGLPGVTPLYERGKQKMR
ncbi:MAG: hypothetical protein LBQ60_20065 [Bacteroidales bacterium]|nr:hypothetical protein [Bacteroidales bacterium]